MTTKDISCTRLHSGAYLCAVMLNGYREKQILFGYSKRAAIREFIANLSASRKV